MGSSTASGLGTEAGVAVRLQPGPRLRRGDGGEHLRGSDACALFASGVDSRIPMSDRPGAERIETRDTRQGGGARERRERKCIVAERGDLTVERLQLGSTTRRAAAQACVVRKPGGSRIASR